MKFRITGVNAIGEDCVLFVEAPDETTAVSHANTQGIYPHSVQAVFDVFPDSPTHEQSQIAPPDKFMLVGLGIAIALSCGSIAIASSSLFWLPAIIGVLIAVVSLDLNDAKQLLKKIKRLIEAMRLAKLALVRWLSRSLSSGTDEGMRNRGKLVLGFGIGFPTLLLLMFLTYWFGYRDNWDIDNFSRITTKCEAIDRAIAESNDYVAAQAYDELIQFIGDHQFKHEFVAERVQTTRDAYAPVEARIEQERRKREILKIAEEKRRLALAEARQRRRKAYEDTATHLSSERYYRDSHGAIISKAEAETKIYQIRNLIDAMPDNLEKSYLGGVLQAVEEEWARVKQQGPVSNP